MKRKCQVLLAVLLMLTAAGCGADKASSGAAEQSSAVSTEAAEEDEAQTTAESTEAEEENAADTTAEDEPETAASAETETTTASGNTDTQQEKPAVKTGGPLTDRLNERIRSWDRGDIMLHCGYEEMGIKTEVTVAQYQDRQYLCMDMLGIALINIYDGSRCYVIDRPSGTYFVDENAEAFDGNEISVVQDLLDESQKGAYRGTGNEVYRGQNAVYEEFVLAETEGVQTLGKFYYANDELIGFRLSEGDKELDIDYRIEFRESSDSSLYTLPDGLREITAEEFSEQMTQRMAEAVGGLENLPFAEETESGKEQAGECAGWGGTCGEAHCTHPESRSHPVCSAAVFGNRIRCEQPH